MATQPAREDDQELIVPLHAEELSVDVTRAVTGRLRVHISTIERTEQVETDITHEDVEIERVAIGRYVDTVPQTRVEGDVTIVPVVEEVLVTERRLVLKEEIHLRRVQTSARHCETVVLREQTATVERLPA